MIKDGGLLRSETLLEVASSHGLYFSSWVRWVTETNNT